MAQHDMDIAPDAINNSFPDVTLALKALASCNSGATAPSTPYDGQLWVDTTNDLLKMRDKANAAWITLGVFDYANGRFEFSANVWHALTTAGFSFKNASGSVIMSLSDTGVLSGADITISATKTLDVSAGTLTLADNQVAVNKAAAATTTARGSVEKATTAEAEAGTAADKFPDVVAVKAAIAAQTTSGVGIGQSWQNMTASRAATVSYQNTTGQPIQVILSNVSAVNWFQVSTDGATWVSVCEMGGAYERQGAIVIPDTHYYRLNGAASVGVWAELR